MKTMISLALGLFLTACANGDVLVYKFTGEIPEGAINTHTEIANGETWTATFSVNMSIVDQLPEDQTWGLYPDAVLNGRLQFSGGYTSPLDFSDSFFVLVKDNATIGTALHVLDAVQIGTDTHNFVLQASNWVHDPLQSDSLPLAGTTFRSAPDPEPHGFIQQLTYEDENGFVEYLSGHAHNITFAAIPEPAMAGLLGVVFMIYGMRRRR